MQNSKLRPLSSMLSLLGPHVALLLLALLALAGGTAINLVVPQIIRSLMDTDISVILENKLNVALGLVSLFLVQAVCFFYRSYFFGKLGQKIVADIRKKLFAAIVAREISFFDSSSSGDLVSRLSADTLLLQDALSIRLSVFIRYGLQVIGGVVLMSLISLQLTLAAIVVLPFLIGSAMFSGKRLKRFAKQQQHELGQSTVVAEEAFGGIRLIRAFNQEIFEQNRYNKAVGRVFEAGLNRVKAGAFMQSFVSFIMNACIVFIMLLGVTLIQSEGLSAGDLTAFLLYGVIVAISFAFLASGYSEFIQALGGFERIFEMLPSDSKDSKESAALFPLEALIEVKFNKVSFSYQTRPNELALDAISFAIKKGESTALIGPSGAGKTTVVNLLMKLYEPSAGELYFNGLNYKKISGYQIRERIALVPQDPFVFGYSLKENLLYGNPAATDEEISWALKKARLSELVASLPRGLETVVGDRGVQLSGGQRQRLAIARAILKKADLIILDEATSALDSENEHLIQEALEEIMQDRTMLIIAHRLSTIRKVQKVIVLDNGKVIQTGTHDSLSKSEGLYRQLVSRQVSFSH